MRTSDAHSQKENIPANCRQHKCHLTEREDARLRPSECVFFRPKKPSPAASRERERDDSVQMPDAPLTG